jgi:hypothetical protein
MMEISQHETSEKKKSESRNRQNRLADGGGSKG